MNSSKEEIICVREDKAYHHQMRPYGILGPPYIITKHTLLYPSSRIKLSWQLLEKKRLTDQLNKCFPSVYVIGHAASLILNSVIQIVLQIVLMSTNAALWYVASGIWGGVYFLCIGLWSIYLVYNRSYWNLVICYILHLFGILMAIGAYLIVNIIAISLYQADCDQNCLNSSIAPVNYVCFFLGVICIIMLLIFLILMPCYIMDSYNRNYEYHQEIIKEKEMKTDFKPDDILMHSSLYSQNSINENTGSLKSNIIDYVETNYNQYPVIQANV